MPVKERKENKPVLSIRARFWVIGIAVLCIYGKSLKFGFVELDDKDLIVDNFEYIKDLSNIPKAFVTNAFYNPSGAKDSKVYYRPLLTLSFMLDAQLSGKSPKYYHLTNILLHIGACLLLFVLFMKLKINPDLAFAAALLFAVHPVLSQAVSWIPGRNDSLLAVFVSAAFIFLIQYRETDNSSKLLLHFLFFGLSIFTKENAIVLPFLCILYVFLSAGLESKPGGNLNIKNLLSLLAGYAVVIAPWYFLRQVAMSGTTADLSFSGLSSSFIKNLPLYLQAIQKSVVPFPLSILSVPADTNYIVSVACIGVLAALLIRSRNKKWSTMLFGFAWFSAFLLPTFVVSIQTGFEHRVYLPLIGLFLAFTQIDFIQDFSLNKSKHILSGAGLFVIFSIMAFNHAGSFENNYSFWKTAASNSKHSALARMNFGLALSQNGETDEAVAMYKEGLSINPNEPIIHNNLGIIYARKKKFSEAEAALKKEIEINPGFSSAYFNLGIVYRQTGRDSLAVTLWKKTVEIDPNDRNAQKMLEQYSKMKKGG